MIMTIVVASKLNWLKIKQTTNNKIEIVTKATNHCLSIFIIIPSLFLIIFLILK